MPFENYRVLSANEAINTYMADLHPSGVLDQLCSILGSYADPARIAVVESEYVDLDYSASYYDQRVRSFLPPKRETIRIHFFSNTLHMQDIAEANETTMQAMASGYLGFVVIRPDNPRTLGRTFLKCPDNLHDLRARFPARIVAPVDLAGISLQVESCPYMTQDSKVMACATVALWMSTTPLANKIPDMVPFTTDAITRVAKSLDGPFGPAVGKRGLTPPEMERGLFAVGFDPDVFYPQSPEHLTEFAHLLSDSGVPPVLLVSPTDSEAPSHAVTVVGYTLEHPGAEHSPTSRVVPAHEFISSLVLHDDQRGMYLVARAVGPADPCVCDVDMVVGLPEGDERLRCYAAMVPLPKRLMLDVFEAKAQTERWASRFARRGWIEDKPLIARTVLVRSNTLKQTLHDRHDAGSGDPARYPLKFVEEVRGLPLPRLAWLVELSYLDDWDFGDAASPPVIADLILDSTATGNALSDVLLLRVPNLIAKNRLHSDSQGFVGIRDPQDHSHPPFPNIPRP